MAASGKAGAVMGTSLRLQFGGAGPEGRWDIALSSGKLSGALGGCGSGCGVGPGMMGSYSRGCSWLLAWCCPLSLRVSTKFGAGGSERTTSSSDAGQQATKSLLDRAG